MWAYGISGVEFPFVTLFSLQSITRGVVCLMYIIGSILAWNYTTCVKFLHWNAKR